MADFPSWHWRGCLFVPSQFRFRDVERAVCAVFQQHKSDLDGSCDSGGFIYSGGGEGLFQGASHSVFQAQECFQNGAAEGGEGCGMRGEGRGGFRHCERGHMYYRYMCMQMEYKIKCKEYEKLCGRDRKIE